MKYCLIIFSLFFVINITGQKKKSTKLGNATIEELKMNLYSKDSTASAVVLFEHGNVYINEKRDFNFTTDYYYRIKILKKEGLNKAIINIPVYSKEKVHDVKAITYNLGKNDEVYKNHFIASKVYRKQVSENWREVSFTLSNVKVGSVIEYKYSVTSPYSQIDDWVFQSDIPKVKSDFTAAILGNWKYNIRLIGFLKLDRDKPSVKKNCVYVPGIGNGSCILLNYGMDSIPAFKEESYMLSKNNFISKISFELKSYTKSNGSVTNYTKTWKYADKNLKSNFLDNQASKKNYFKRKVLKDSVFTIQNELDKGKYVYNLIKNNFVWDEKYWPNRKVRVKKAFESKKGNIFDINLSLYNALQAVNIQSKLVLLATRGKGLPTKLYPIVTDFNYLVVKVVINGKVYFLDASDKNLPFGLIRFDALNGEGRVMDFKNGSYWESISLGKRTITKRRLLLELNEDNIQGSLVVTRSGYSALHKRNDLIGKKEEDILDDFESKYPSIEVENFDTENLNNPEKKLLEILKINIENDFEGSKRININPFFINRLTENPFKLNERDYPVDFGYPRTNVYLMSLKIPDNYLIKKIPKNKTLVLPNRGGSFILNAKQKGKTINIYLKVALNKKSFTSNEYFYLKEFYNQLIKTQDTYIELEKK